MSLTSIPTVIIYTDGACDPNPGPGGWAAILLRPNLPPEQFGGSAEQTTNNRMELQAVIEALRTLDVRHRVTVRTDSQYVCSGAVQRQRLGWRRAGGRGVKNADLWVELAEAVGRHEVNWEWVKGHNGDPLNEEVDALSRAMVPRSDLPLGEVGAIHVFTGACCLGTSSGPGGWAVTMCYRDARKELSGGEPETSSNRMHLHAAVEGLRAIKKPFPVHVYTTSDYLHAGITRWAPGWQERDWRTGEGKRVAHRDLWEMLILAAAPLNVRYHVVGNGEVPEEMRRPSEMARAAARQTRVGPGEVPSAIPTHPVS